MAAHVWSREGRNAREEGRAHQPPGRGYAVSKTKRPVGAIITNPNVVGAPGKQQGERL